MRIHNFRELIAWQKGMQLATKVYEITRKFPSYETYGLSSQIQRSATSIPSNIAEGSGRSTSKELIHFLSFSLGSAYELETELLLAKQFNYFDADYAKQIIEEVIEVQKLIYSLIKKFNSSESN